jgi:formamidopyrimidine-DNA glycosylase
MPEMLEAETARVLIEARALNREIAKVHAPDAWFLKRGLTPRIARSILPGLRLTAARRRGKLLLVDTAASGVGGPVLAMHLGMSGRILVDGEAAGDPLLYAANGDKPAWRRFGLKFADGRTLYLGTAPRCGRLDPDEDRLGRIRNRESGYAAACSGDAPVKAVLMDQSRIAGLGTCSPTGALSCGVDPARSRPHLTDDEARRVARDLSHDPHPQ